MEKLTKNWFAILMIAMMSLSFTACSDDDDEPGSGNDDFLIGTWRTATDNDNFDGYAHIVFQEDGVMLIEDDHDWDETYYVHDPKNQSIFYEYDGPSYIYYRKLSDTRVLVSDQREFDDETTLWEKI